MPRNAAGVYSLPLPAVITGTVIDSVWANDTTDDIAAELTNSLDRYGRGGMLAPFKIYDGSSGAPGLAFTADTDCGAWRNSSNDWSLGAGSVEGANLNTSGFKVNGFKLNTLSPSQITSNQNDYNPASLSTASYLRLDTDAARELTGLQGGVAGRTIRIHYIGTTTLTLKDESGSSTAAYRFALPADLVLGPDMSVDLTYDATTSRWRMTTGAVSSVMTPVTMAASLSAARAALGATGYSDTRAFGGRVTLASGIPVMTTDVTSATTVYFTPYKGNVIPIYDGTDMVPTQFTELSQATSDTTKSPAAVAASKNYDKFVWNDAGTIRCTRGPTWDSGAVAGSDTVRGTGAGSTELELVKGVYVNKYAITNGPAAQRGTFVGSIRSNGSSQIDWKLGSVAAGGGEAWLGVSNFYNAEDVSCVVSDSVNSYTYQSTTVRSMNSSDTNRVSALNCMPRALQANRAQFGQLSASQDSPLVGFGLNATNAYATNSTIGYVTPQIAAAGQQWIYAGIQVSVLGWNFLQATESVNTTTAPVTYYGDAGGSLLSTKIFATVKA